MRRAGLDYHEYAGISTYEGFSEFIDKHGDKRLFGISTKGTRRYHEVAFEPGDFLIFGPETRGLPDSVRQQLGMDQILRIPMQAHSRSLNLSNTVAVVVYEAWRQLGFAHGH